VCPTTSIDNEQHSNNSSFFQVFCGKIPRDVYEDELIPLFEKCGTIWDLRLMMDPLTNLNRGYAFVTFTTTEAAQEAVNQVMLERFFLYGLSQN
jgi:RNA recognition motif-containing protein